MKRQYKFTIELKEDGNYAIICRAEFEYKGVRQSATAEIITSNKITNREDIPHNTRRELMQEIDRGIQEYKINN